MSDFLETLKNTVITSANVKAVNDELTKFLLDPSESSRGLSALKLFAEKNKQTIERLEVSEAHLASQLTELKEEHRAVKMDNENLTIDLKQSRIKLDQMTLERNEGEQVKAIKAKVQAKFEEIKKFNYLRTECTKEMSDLIDQTFELVGLEPIDLDPEASELDYDKELFEKLYAKILCLNENIRKKGSG